MAEKELESDDPYEFVAVRFPVEPGVDADERMARVFVEEYAMLGVPREKIMQIFRSQAFAGTHTVFATRGEPFVQAIVDDVYNAPAQEGR